MKRCAIEAIFGVYREIIFFVQENLQREGASFELRCTVKYAETIPSLRLRRGFEVIDQDVYDSIVAFEHSKVQGFVSAKRFFELYQRLHHCYFLLEYIP